MCRRPGTLKLDRQIGLFLCARRGGWRDNEGPANREKPASTSEAAATVQPMGRVHDNVFFM
jgi:hypothetical protein